MHRHMSPRVFQVVAGAPRVSAAIKERAMRIQSSTGVCAWRIAQAALLVLLALGGLMACASTGQLNVDQAPPPTWNGTSVATSTAQTAAIPRLEGPKRVVAVQKFESIGTFTQKYGDWDVGGG